MFLALKKLEKLKPGKRLEKAALIALSASEELSRTGRYNSGYLRQVLEFVKSDMPDEKGRLLESLITGLTGDSGRQEVRNLENVRYLLLSAAGMEPAEWDLRRFSFDSSIREKRVILPINVYLDDLRSPFNVGSILRSAESFCYEHVFLSSFTPSPAHRRAIRSSMGTGDTVKWQYAAMETLPRPLFALETGGTGIDEFVFPESGTVIVGSEESGVGPAALKAAGESLGIVSIPLYGIKGSINAGVAFGIISYCWVRSILSGKREMERD